MLDSEQNTAGKPIKVDVFDPNMIKLSKIGDAVLGQDNRIRVDTGKQFLVSLIYQCRRSILILTIDRMFFMTIL